VLGTDGSFASSAEADSASGALEDDVEVHAENTSEGVVLESQIDVLLNTEAEATWLRREVPVSEKFLFLSSLSLTLRPLSRISSAFSPRTVTCAAIFSFLLMPNDRMVYLAREGTGFCPDRSSSTLEAEWLMGYLW
jgi:hypothetical protein